MSERYNLRTILTNINHNGCSDAVDKILIPRIQRAYAQGRKNESGIRASILEDIFGALRSGTLLELNFIYGTVRNGVFELLDGQQRLTTLYLIHWYVACREKRLEEISGMLRKFSYETRHTSADFCEGLSSYCYEKTEGQTVSQAIRKRISWYFKSFDLDSTVESMLRMLDSIEKKYDEAHDTLLFDNLDNLQFYVLCLDDFKLTDELYIKMNARGLPLTPFENFKADLINFMKDSGAFDDIVTYDGHDIPLYLRIAAELDGKWADIFWDDDDYLNIDKNEYDEDNEDYSVKYFRFFYRFFASRFVTRYSTEIQGKDMNGVSAFQFFYKDSEDQRLDRYARFSPYLDILKGDDSAIKVMETILNTLTEHYQKDIKPLMTPPWGSDDWDFFSPVLQGGKGFSLQRRIVFSAICDYIEYFKSFDAAEFAKIMRVVWNVVENTDVTGVPVMTNLERTFNVMIRSAATSGKEFYSFLASFHEADRLTDGSAGERSLPLNEEITKAGYIIENEEWLPLFLEAEKNPFCRGMVGFFLRQNSSDTPEMFKRRLGYVNEFFGEKGVCAKYAEEGDHILLRALISRVDDIDRINSRYFTDESEAKYNALRILLSNAKSQSVRNYMCEVLEKESLDDVLNSFKDATGSEISFKIPYDDNWRPRISTAFKRLYSNPNYLNWGIRRKAFRLYCRDSNYYLLEPNTSTNLVLMSTNRDEIIKNLIDDGWAVQNTVWDRSGKTQREIYDEYGFFIGYNVVLEKELKGWKVRLSFSTNSKLFASVYCSEDDIEPLVAEFGEISREAVKESSPERHSITEPISYDISIPVEDIKAGLFGEEGVITRLPAKP